MNMNNLYDLLIAIIIAQCAYYVIILVFAYYAIKKECGRSATIQVRDLLNYWYSAFYIPILGIGVSIGIIIMAISLCSIIKLREWFKESKLYNLIQNILNKEI